MSACHPGLATSLVGHPRCKINVGRRNFFRLKDSLDKILSAGLPYQGLIHLYRGLRCMLRQVDRRHGDNVAGESDSSLKRGVG